MSFELQLAAAAQAGLKLLEDRVAIIEEHLGDDLKELIAQKQQQKVVEAQAAAPLELTPEEKQAIIAARLEIAKQTEAKNAPQS